MTQLSGATVIGQRDQNTQHPRDRFGVRLEMRCLTRAHDGTV